MKAIVTGHSRGLGAAIAENLLSRNIPVLGLSRAGNAELQTRFSQGLLQYELDLADTAAIARWIDGGALKQYLSDCTHAFLVNNAGIVQPVGPIDTHEFSTISRAISLNVAAPMMLASAFAALTTEANDRRILHISSGAGRAAYPGWSVYCATKAALDHHARAVVLDKMKNLRICSLAPGVIDTDMQTEIRQTSIERFPLREKFESLKREGALSSPQSCAQQLVDYLLSAQFGDKPVADLRELG